MSSNSSLSEEVKDRTSSSSKKEVTEPVETTKLSVECSSMGKSDARISGPEEDLGDSESKSESEDEDSSEEEEEEDSESESEDDSSDEEEENSEPEWDKDSYDGRKYHSAENEDSDKEADLKRRRYKRQLIETKGFFVDPENMTPYFFKRIVLLTDLDGPFLDDEDLTSYHT